MAKKTIAQIREDNIYKLAKRSKNFETDPDIFNKARKAMSSFYRLAAFSERLFYINNDSKLYDYYKGSKLDAMETREETWRKRVKNYLSEFDADICYNGIYPSIIEKKRSAAGGVNDLFLTAWY
jgi:hypothetical protein